QVGGTLVVECAASGAERVRVNVKDSGAGLTAEEMDQLFQPFNRLGREGGGQEGTGIGLVVARQLIELMGGTIGVESAVGKGSVFWFELLRCAEPVLGIESSEAASPMVREAGRSAPQRTVLYVEDNPANLKLVEQLI